MLTFRNTNIFFIALLAILIGVHVKYGLPIFAYCLLLIAYSLIIFWGCINVSSNFFIPIVCKADTDKKEIAISFDDGPAENYTPQILTILKTENVKATFFCIGNRIAGNQIILRQMQEDLKQMDEEMEKFTGLKPKLFRPPYGVTNPNLAKAIKNGGYTPVGWSVRSLDTVIKDRKKLADKINAGIKPGAVFLFHDTSKITLEVLPQFIKEVKNRGYNIIPLDKLLALQPYA